MTVVVDSVGIFTANLTDNGPQKPQDRRTAEPGAPVRGAGAAV